MKKLILLLAFLPCFSMFAVEPSLPTKDLSISPVIGTKTITYEAGTRKLHVDDSFAPNGNYTVEVKAKLLSTALKGLVVESRNNARNGFRMAIHSNGIDNLSGSNYSNTSNPVSVNSDLNDVSSYHTFRFAVEGTNVHIYRDGVYITSTSIDGIYNDNLLNDHNGSFESIDLSMWNFITEGQGLTTEAGEFRTGTAALKLVNVGITTVQSSLTIKGLKPSTTYALSFYAKYLSKTVNKGNMRYELKLGGYDGLGSFVKNSGVTNNNIVSNPTNSMDPTLAQWTLNGSQFTTGATDSVAILDISGWNGDNTYVIDDMVLHELETTPTTGATVASNLVTNGDFASDAAGWSAGAWPLGNVLWAATTDEFSNPTGGQLQIREASWVARSMGTYKASVSVLPNKIYKLSAKISHRVVGTSNARIIRVVDGRAAASTSYDITETGTPATNLTTYYNAITPAFTSGPASTSIDIEFTTSTNSSTGSPVVVMTLDDVVLQEYEATFPSYLKYGKAYQSEASNFEIAYINYDLTGAYAPQNTTTSFIGYSDEIKVVVQNGQLTIKGSKAGDKVEIFNSLGMKINSFVVTSNDSNVKLNSKGVLIVKVNNSLKKVIL